MGAATETPDTPTYLTLPEIGRRYQVDGETVRKWIVRGVRIRGQTVRLQALRVGYTYRVTQEAWEDFLNRCNPDTAVESAERQAGQRREAQAAAARLRERLAPKGRK